MTAVLVRNRVSGPTVFRDEASKVQVEWAGAGDPGGDDHQYIPEDLLANVQFMKGLQRGIFEVVPAETLSPEPAVASVQVTETGEVGPGQILPPPGQPPVADAGAAALAAQRAAFEARTATATEAALAAIVDDEVNDMVTVPCIGPNGRPGPGKCQQPVPVVEKTKNDTAPLCSQHESLRPEFVPTETDKIDPVTGKAEVRWSRAKVTAPERPLTP